MHEHRIRQREAIVREAESILLAEGAASVTPAAIGRAVGLARSSVYEYFPSTGDLLAEVARRAITEWSVELGAQIEPAGRGWPRLETYVRASLDLVQQGKHEIADRLAGFDFTPPQMQHFMAQHDLLSSPLPEILGDLAVTDIRLTGGLVQGLVDAASRHVRAGADSGDVTARVMALLRGGLGG